MSNVNSVSNVKRETTHMVLVKTNSNVPAIWRSAVFALTVVMRQVHCYLSTSPASANTEWQEFVPTLAMTRDAAPLSWHSR